MQHLPSFVLLDKVGLLALFSFVLSIHFFGLEHIKVLTWTSNIIHDSFTTIMITLALSLVVLASANVVFLSPLSLTALLYFLLYLSLSPVFHFTALNLTVSLDFKDLQQCYWLSFSAISSWAEPTGLSEYLFCMLSHIVVCECLIMPILSTKHLPTFVFIYLFILQKHIDEYHHISLPFLANKQTEMC